MRAEEFLLQYKIAKSRIESKAAEIEELESILTSGSIDPSKERVQSSIKFDREKILAEIVDTRKELLVLKQDAVEKMQEVSCVIEQVKPEVLSRLLCMRYIECRRWEYIATYLGYTARHVRRLKFEALEQIGEIVNEIQENT